MFRFTLLLCFGIAGWMKSSAQASGDTIIWKSRNQLTYEDFRALQPVTGDSIHRLAEISTGINYKIDFKSGIPVVTTFAFMKRSESWMKLKDPETLLHEQTHFDISMMYAKKLKEIVDTISTRDIVKFLRSLNKEVEIIVKELDIEQDRFDNYYRVRIHRNYYGPILDSCLGK